MQEEAGKFRATALESREAFIARRKHALFHALSSTFEKALSGYSYLRESLQEDLNRDMSPFALDLTRLAAVDLQKPLILYEVFGWDEEVLGTFYKQACCLYQQERYKEALDAFTFLSFVSPLAADLYSALAICFTACNEEAQAQEALELASYLQVTKEGK